MLLENFPVRGGFSQLYTSHELYCYKLKSCKPELLAAQGLGTVLRLVTSGTRTMHSDPRPMPQHSPRHNAPSPGTRRRTQAHTQTATRMLAVCLIRISADSKGSVTKVSFFVDGISGKEGWAGNRQDSECTRLCTRLCGCAHGCAHGSCSVCDPSDSSNKNAHLAISVTSMCHPNACGTACISQRIRLQSCAQ